MQACTYVPLQVCMQTKSLTCFTGLDLLRLGKWLQGLIFNRALVLVPQKLGQSGVPTLDRNVAPKVYD